MNVVLPPSSMIIALGETATALASLRNTGAALRSTGSTLPGLSAHSSETRTMRYISGRRTSPNCTGAPAVGRRSAMQWDGLPAFPQPVMLHCPACLGAMICLVSAAGLLAASAALAGGSSAAAATTAAIHGAGGKMGLRTVILLPVTFLVAGRIAPFR